MVVKRKYTQKNRRISITTPLGEDKLLLRSISGSDAISQPFQYHLELLSEDDAIDFKSIVGQRVTVKLLLADASPRYFNGFISRFSQGARDGVLTSYHAEMVPWLWFLTRTADCRIFQKKSIPDIIQQIFKDLGFTDFKLNLYSNFEPRDYCVQYRETDFHFVSRLMEQVGVYYFFEHNDANHTMILGNDPSVHKECPGQPTARYELTAGGWQDDDVVTEWRLEEAIRPGSWAQTDYNFETPSTSLLVALPGPNKYEIYDYPGDYATRSDGDVLTKVRLEEDTTPGMIGQGGSDCRAFAPGYKFTLADHYRSDLNQPWLITEVHHRASQGGDYGGGAMVSQDKEFSYQNTFTCIPASVPFRPGRVTPRPVVRGCQTAMVVGPPGEEIHTDKYGRVKVQFHWDREGKRNENSSCWIRVSHPWAGKGWGAVSIPRIGQEVVVDFLEGDPDQPIIVGRVYNAESMPPYSLPAGAMVSGFKSNSTKGGGGYNEIAADDTKGKEKVTIHGQYDMNTTVQHDKTTVVKSGNRTITVESGTNTETIKGTASLTVQAGARMVDVTGGDYSATSSDGVFLHGKSKGVGILGDAEGVGITGNGKGVGITGNGKGVGIVGNGEGVGIIGNAKGVGIEGNGEGVGIIGNGKGVGIQGNGEGITCVGNPHFYAEGTSNAQIKGPKIDIGDGEITIHGSKIVLGAGGGSVVIDGSGVTIQGTKVSIN